MTQPVIMPSLHDVVHTCVHLVLHAFYIAPAGACLTLQLMKSAVVQPVFRWLSCFINMKHYAG